MIFRQLFDAQSSTYTYLLGDPRSRRAVLVDPVFEQHFRDSALVRELDLTLAYTLETHVHADHVTGAWLMKEATGSLVAIAGAAGATGADRLLSDGDRLEVGDLAIEVLATPGHTAGCLSFVVHEAKLVVTGDALLIRGSGRTDFQGGDATTLFRSVREKLFALPPDFTVYPGHDYDGRSASSIGEERRHNPRLGDGVRQEDFVGYMASLGLPHPKKLAVAVPANLACGRTDASSTVTRPGWGPVVRTFAGVWQVEPELVFQKRKDLLVVDVREPEEVRATPIGTIEGSIAMPLRTLRERASEVPHDRPVVLVCPAGARSAIAAQILEKAGVPNVANMRGGLLEWRLLGLPLDSSG